MKRLLSNIVGGGGGVGVGGSRSEAPIGTKQVLSLFPNANLNDTKSLAQLHLQEAVTSRSCTLYKALNKLSRELHGVELMQVREWYMQGHE